MEMSVCVSLCLHFPFSSFRLQPLPNDCSTHFAIRSTRLPFSLRLTCSLQFSMSFFASRLLPLPSAAADEGSLRLSCD